MSQWIHIQPADSESMWCGRLDMAGCNFYVYGHDYENKEYDLTLDSRFGAKKWNYYDLCISAREAWHQERKDIRRPI